MLAEILQDNACNLIMLFESHGVDEDVVKIYTNNSLCNQIMEDVIHHRLKYGGAVSQAEEHYQSFKEPAIGLECCLPVILFLNTHIVVAPVDIQLGEVVCAS